MRTAAIFGQFCWISLLVVVRSDARSGFGVEASHRDRTTSTLNGSNATAREHESTIGLSRQTREVPRVYGGFSVSACQMLSARASDALKSQFQPTVAGDIPGQRVDARRDRTQIW